MRVRVQILAGPVACNSYSFKETDTKEQRSQKDERVLKTMLRNITSRVLHVSNQENVSKNKLRLVRLQTWSVTALGEV